MTDIQKPDHRPKNPRFSSGPCAKRSGWTAEFLNHGHLGRSHRSGPAKARIQRVIDLTRELLCVPDDYRIGIVPASDTGAVEMALWSMLGARGVDMLAWESFGTGWVNDVTDHIGLDDVRVLAAGYGELPDLALVDWTRDVVFTWNGTTSGVRVPGADWIDDDREGLSICDATSAAFAQELDFSKLDVTTFSWQKVLGGEGAHGVIILSPRAVQRLETFTAKRPLPKIFRLTKNGKLIEGIFNAATINTPSMMAVEDAIDALEWAKSLGTGAMRRRADENFAVLDAWIGKTDWIDNLAVDPATRSNTSVCLKIVDADVTSLDPSRQAAFARSVAARLDSEAVAYDIGAYRDAPPGLRIWTGSTVEASDLQSLTGWLDWSYATEKSAL